MNRHLHINGRAIGADRPAYVIAELSANHDQDFEKAASLVRAAKAAGADAVKLQTYTPDTMTIDCDNEYFRIGPGSPWTGRNLYDLYRDGSMPWEWQPRLKQIAEDLGMALFSTPFDGRAVDFLESMDVPAYKIASFEITDIGLIRQVGRTGRPVIISTGMATLGEIQEAVDTARVAGAGEIALLHCTSAYPAPPEAANLRTIPHMQEAFDVPVGLSDHTLGIAVAAAAVALGASIVEKHFTLSRRNPGPDSAFSLEPAEFRAMVEAIRTVGPALGSIHYGATEAEVNSRNFRRSLFVVKDMRAGEEFTGDHVRSIRPGHGLNPRHLSDVLGRRSRHDIARGTPLAWNHIA